MAIQVNTDLKESTTKLRDRIRGDISSLQGINTLTKGYIDHNISLDSNKNDALVYLVDIMTVNEELLERLSENYDLLLFNID